MYMRKFLARSSVETDWGKYSHKLTTPKHSTEEPINPLGSNEDADIAGFGPRTGFSGDMKRSSALLCTEECPVALKWR
jgi:hypothetical protein